MSTQRPSPIVPVAIGILLTAVLLAALGYLASKRRQAQSRPPELTLLGPVGGQVVDSPLVIRFASGQPIKLTPNGWLAGRWHLHARVNGIEHMPAAADISASDSTYEWVVPAAPRGRATVRLGWADLRHREVTGGRSNEIDVVVR